MNSASRRTRARKVADAQERSDFEDIESATTPTRKKRKINHRETAAVAEKAVESMVKPNNGTRRRKGATRETEPLNEEEEEDSNVQDEDVDAIIRGLRKAKYNIQARVDFANELHEVSFPHGKQAYAKIAGNGWTFYVDNLNVRIGRPPDERSVSAQNGRGTDGSTADESLVDIDLGPGKLVSRLHAEIRYDDKAAIWCVSVSGRNGIKLDESPVQRGETASLHSGSVIDIAGTQMMFVTPNDPPTVHPAIAAQTLRADKDEDDEDSFDMAPAAPSQRTPSRHPSSRSGPQRPSSSRDPNYQQSAPSKTRTNYATVSPSTNHLDASGDPQSQGSQTKSRGSPTYSKGLVLESPEYIDYSADSAKDLKPPQSYAQLIGMAILSNEEEKLTLAKIYDYIKDNYAFYRFSGGGWQNSIRHNLSLNKCFEKIARRTDEPGKGMKWQIVPEHRNEFVKKSLSSIRKTTEHGSSAPSSPSKSSQLIFEHNRQPEDPFVKGPFREAMKHSKSSMKTSPGSTPPMASYPLSKQAMTPDRGTNLFMRLHGADQSSPRSQLFADMSPFPYHTRKDRNSQAMNEAAAAGTPGGPTMLLNSDMNDHLITPLVTRHAPRLVPPSTARLPSQFMPMSSPAPFWKYAAFGSTPARPGLDISPVKGSPTKAMKGIDVGLNSTHGKMEIVDDGAGVESNSVRSSSPPLPDAEVAEGSPTKAISHRGGDKASQLPSQAYADSPPPSALPPHSHPIQPLATASSLHSRLVPPAPRVDEENDDDDEDEGGIIDLARGFQPIGTFHRNISAGVIR